MDAAELARLWRMRDARYRAKREMSEAMAIAVRDGRYRELREVPEGPERDRLLVTLSLWVPPSAGGVR